MDEISPCGRNDSMPLMAWGRLRRRRSRRRNLPLFSRKTPVISTAGRNLICLLVIGRYLEELDEINIHPNHQKKMILMKHPTIIFVQLNNNLKKKMIYLQLILTIHAKT